MARVFDRRLFRRCAALVLCSLLLAQSMLAVAAPCAALTPAEQSHHGENAMDSHAGHAMGTDADLAGADTCCDGGYCSVSGCLPLSTLASSHLHLSLAVPTTVEQAVLLPFDDLTPGPLYRPPIAR